MERISILQTTLAAVYSIGETLMLYLPLLLIHIVAAVTGLLSGFLAVVLRKGSGLHGAAGSVFFVSMLCMSTSAVYLAAFLHPVAINVIAGLLTFYLVTTAWRAAKHRELRAGRFDLGALLFVLAVGVGGITVGLEAAGSASGSRDGVPAPVYFVFGSVALLCTLGDTRMFLRGGVSGGRRIARHLWRMCLALLIATLSLYPGQARLFPMWLRETNLLFVPHILLIGMLIFWAVRVGRRTRAERRVELPASPGTTVTARAGNA